MGRDRLDPGEATFQLLVERARDAALIWGADGAIRYVNAAAVAVLGYDSAAHLIGRSIHELVHPDGLRRVDGEIAQLEMHSHEVEFGGRPATLATCRDASHARRMEADLRQSQKMEVVGQLAGGIAHDFNNVLGVILSNASFALEDLGASHAVSADLREIERAAQRATKLTKQLLAFSRKQAHQPKPTALDAVVKNLLLMIGTTLGETIQLEVDLPAGVGTIEADRGHLEQVMMNLAVNARDAMPDRGTLAIRVINVDHAEHGRCVTLEVADTGIGMSPATKARIFEPFYTTKEVGKGTGLGLAMVFGIVKQNKGWIEVDSELGKGTTFRLLFPRTDRPAMLSITMATLSTKPEPRAATILLVEDDDLLRASIRRQISGWGYRLLEAANGEQALGLVRDPTAQIDLLLTDLVMPGMDGRALAQQLLLERPNMSVVIMSGYTEHPAVKTRAFAGSHFIEKPFTRGQLSTLIERALTEATEPVRIAR